MRTLSDLANVLTGCRVVSAARWDRAARLGGGAPGATLDALAAEPPEWFRPGLPDCPEEPPGLTEYQREAIEHWLADGDAALGRQLALNQFVLLERLGSGGQGQVYRARQLNPPRFVAVKTLTRDTESSRARFEQEARAMMKVQHPGVARFHLYERVRDHNNRPTDEYLIAMEFVDGTDLHRLVQWLGPLPWPFVVKWAVDVLGGLRVIHQSGFVHRDVKPANVIALGPPPEPGADPADTAAKLLDFGAVGTVEHRGPASATRRVFVGTREYAPPEQWDERVYPASDLYALGGTLFYALTGRAPYEVEGRDAVAFMRAHAKAPIPDVRAFAPDVPEGVADLLNQMLAKRPDARGTADELSAEFQKLIPTPGTPVKPAARPAPKPKTATRPSLPAVRPEPRPEPDDEPEGLLGSLLAPFERLFLPAHLRPVAGSELTPGERLMTLLRRPLVLILLAALFGGLIFWAVR